MTRLSRRSTIIAMTALALSACGQAETASSASTGQTSSNGPMLTEMTLGDEAAPLEIVEYASWTCPACLQFHEDVIPMIKTEYVETGKVKFTFREFPTPPANVSVAGFALARCAGSDKYYDVIDALFEAQTGILDLARNGGDIEGALRTIAADYGISDTGFETCISDKNVTYAISDAVMKGDSQGVNSTPTVFVNGEKLAGYDWRTAEGMKALLDAKLSETDGATPADASAE